MRGRSVHDLLRDYHDALARVNDLPKAQARRLRDYERFLRTRQHVLAVDPAQLFPQACAQPADSGVRADVEGLPGPPRPWFRLRNPPETDPNPALLLTVQVGLPVFAVGMFEQGGRQYALVGCEDGSLRRYDLANGKEITPPLQGDTGALKGVALSGDGRRALSGAGDCTLRLWDLEGGTCLRAFEDYPRFERAVALSGDGRRALSGFWLWDLEGGTCRRAFEGPIGMVMALALSGDGRRALSGS